MVERCAMPPLLLFLPTGGGNRRGVVEPFVDQNEAAEQSQEHG